MKNPPSDSEDFHLMGVRVKRQYISEELELSLERIPKEAMATMIRGNVLPILSIKEVRHLGREFTLVDDFATKLNINRLLSLLQDSPDSLV